MNLVKQAHDIIGFGYNPIPCKYTKAPKLPTGHKFLYQEIDNIDDRFKDCDFVGIVCGDISDGFYAIDFDAHNDEPITEIYNDFLKDGLVQQLLEENSLSCYKTAGGGFHIYFKMNETQKGEKWAEWEDQDVMIELRGHGQYVIVAPSKGYKHDQGPTYEKLRHIDFEDYLYLKNLAFSYSKHLAVKSKSKSNKEWPTEWPNNTIKGVFNNEGETVLKELIEEAGWTHSLTRRDGVEYWIRPGKEAKDGAGATFGNKFNMFYVFSSSAEPFKENTAYNPFDVYTLLKFGGDWKRAIDSITPVETIVALEKPPILDFPIDVFPPKVRAAMDLYSETLNYNIDFMAIGFMFCIGTLTGNRFKVRVKNGRETPPIFWFVALGLPGTIKSHPLKAMIKPLEIIDKKSKIIYDAAMIEWTAGGSKGIKPRFKQMVIKDATLEAIHYVHENTPKGLGLFKDELNGFFGDMNKYRKGSDVEFWLESFNNSSYIINRVTKEPKSIDNIFINIIGTMQPDVFKTMIEGADNGIVDRFLFTQANTEIKKETMDEMPQEIIDWYIECVNDFNKFLEYEDEDSADIILLSLKCSQIRIDYSNSLIQIQESENETQQIKNYVSKIRTYIPRFALLLAIIDSVFLYKVDQVEIQENHMKNATKICDYFISSARSIFAKVADDKEIKDQIGNLKSMTVNEKILELHKKGMSGVRIAEALKKSTAHVSKVINYKY